MAKRNHPNFAGCEENLTGFLTNISSDHNYIHQGLGFSLVAVTTALAAAGTWKIGFTTPAVSTGKYLHWRPAQFSSSGNNVRHRLYEGSVYTVGTPQQPINRNRNRANLDSKTVFYIGATAALTGNLTITTKAGGGFANQPAGDGVEALSDNAADVGQILTIYGTKTGATTTITEESIVLNGATFAATILQTWQNILGASLSAACAGTVTIREASTNATIITIAAGTLTAGIETPTITNAREQIVNIIASGASTMPVGIIGTGADGSALTSVTALNGATAKAMNTSIFKTLSKVLIGAVESARNVSVTIPDKIISSTSVGSASTSSRSGGNGGGSDLELILQPATQYVAYFENIGTVTATDIDVDFFFYQEEAF
jgi:hypothetical protein